MRIASIAQNPMAVAAAVRTKFRRLMPNLMRQRSASRLARSMIASCSALGSGGRYSAFGDGSTSTGMASDMSSHECRYGFDVNDGPFRFQLIIEQSPRTHLSFPGGYGRSRSRRRRPGSRAASSPEAGSRAPALLG